MDKIMLIIACISTLWYGWNIGLDAVVDKRKYSAHIGYASISILSWLEFIPELSFALCCVIIPYSLIIFASKIKE